MIAYSVESNLASFTARLREYVAVSRKTPLEAVQKKSKDFGFALSARLKALAPGKGVVRTERLAALKAGGGLLIRPSVVASINAKFSGQSSVKRGGKRLNIQALKVRKELGLRESGRGYSGFIARLASVDKLQPGQSRDWLGKFQQKVSQAALQSVDSGSSSTASMDLSWTDNNQARPGEALSTPDAQRALAGALAETEADMAVYIERKHAEAAAKL